MSKYYVRKGHKSPNKLSNCIRNWNFENLATNLDQMWFQWIKRTHNFRKQQQKKSTLNKSVIINVNDANTANDADNAKNANNGNDDDDTGASSDWWCWWWAMTLLSVELLLSALLFPLLCCAVNCCALWSSLLFPLLCCDQHSDAASYISSPPPRSCAHLKASTQDKADEEEEKKKGKAWSLQLGILL